MERASLSKTAAVAVPSLTQLYSQEVSFVLKKLEESKGDWPRVARESGVSYRTLKKIATGETADPEVDNLARLANYFRRCDQAATPAVG